MIMLMYHEVAAMRVVVTPVEILKIVYGDARQDWLGISGREAEMTREVF